MPLHLIANPGRAIDIANLLIGLIQSDATRFATHQAARNLAVAPGAIHQTMRLGLVVIGDDLEFLILLIRTRLRSRQRPRLAATLLPLRFDLLPPRLLLGIRYQGHHHSVTAKIDARRARSSLAVRRRPVHWQLSRLLGFGDPFAFGLNQHTQRFPAEFHLGSAGQIGSALIEILAIAVESTRHFPHA